MYMSVHEMNPEEAETRSAALEGQTSYRNTKFITVFTRPSHRPMTWARWTQSIHSLSIALRPTSILFCNFNIFLKCNPFSTDNSTTTVKICGWNIYFEFIHVSVSLAILRETTLDTAGNQGFRFSYVKSKSNNPINSVRTYYCVNLKKSKYIKLKFMNFTKMTYYKSK